MKYLHNLAGFLCAFCLMAILLITSVEAVALKCYNKVVTEVANKI